MSPYKDHPEYLSDIRKLAGLSLEVFVNGDVNAAGRAFALRSEIIKRAGETDFFIPLEYVIRAFSLSETEEYLLFAVFMYENDLNFRQTLSEATGTAHLTILTIEKLASLFAGASTSRPMPYSFADNILRMGESGEYMLKTEITRFIFESGRLVDRHWLQLYYPRSEKSEPIFDKGLADGFSRLVKSLVSDKRQYPSIITIKGKAGGGRRSLVKRAVSENRIPILFVDCALLAHEGDLTRLSDEIKTVCILTGSLICLNDIDIIMKDPEKSSALLWGIKPAARLVLATSEESLFDLPCNYEMIEYTLPPPSIEISVKLWEAEAGEFNINADFNVIAGLFKLSPRQIKQAAMAAYATASAEGAGEITQAMLTRACRDISARGIGALGRIISPSFNWEDLILPLDCREEIRNALERIKLRKKVFEDWGFIDKTPYGAGVHILLHGPSGTGKTMAARVIAGELGVPLYQLDMALVVSKYIGETEKNLEKIFEEGENSNSILFFDEADAIFGKRTEIKDAHDRHANLQVSFLLQKIEEYEGVVILATNFIKNLDEAFKRRFHFIIGFSMPDRQCRKKIWENAFPNAAPLENDIDFDYLSELSMSGSGIKYAALSSAFCAAREGKPVGMRHILKAVRHEASKNGWSFDEGLFEYT